MTEIKSVEGIGQVQIADEVIAVIAGTATLEVEGVVGLAGHFTGDIAEILGKKNFSKGVKIEVVEKEVIVAINVIIKFGCKIPEVSKEMQLKVKNAIETMTGLIVSEVNINVAAVQMEKEKESAKA